MLAFATPSAHLSILSPLPSAFTSRPPAHSRPTSPCRRLHLPSAVLSFGDAVEAHLSSAYGASAARVLDSFSAVRRGNSLETGVGTPRHRRATSRVLGLTDEPFLPEASFPWLARLCAAVPDIAAELSAADKGGALAAEGTNVWVPAAREEATGYGPDWRTLVLMDREWDDVNCGFFPVTTGVLKGGGVPCVEAFFARQACGTGIALHTDDSNFILTAHVTIEAEAGTAWIEVGGVRKYWSVGEGMVFDTSFFHRTMNESESVERVVLLVRFWHPYLTDVEREALGFIFRAIEDPAIVEGQEEKAFEKGRVGGGDGARVGAASQVPRGARRTAKKDAKKKVERAAKRGGGVGFGR